MISPQREILFSNPVFAALLGASPQEIAGHPLAIFARESALADPQVPTVFALPGGVSYKEQCVLGGRVAEGTPVRLNASALRRGTEPPWAAVIIVEDLTECSRLALEVRERQKELAALHALARQLMQATDADEAALARFVAELLPPAFLVPGQASSRVQLGATEVQTPGFTESPEGLRREWATSDGGEASIEVRYSSGTPEPFLQQEHALLDSIADLLRLDANRRSELRAREEAARALAQRELQLQVALDVARLHWIVWDMDTDLASLSEGAARLLGFPPETSAVTLRQLRECVHPEDQPHVSRAFWEERNDQVSNEVEYRVVWPTGEIRWVLARGGLFEDAHGVVAHHRALLDVTERHALEDEMRQAQKMDAMGRLAGGVAHDFNNLLGVIHAADELALEQVPSGGQLEADLLAIRDAAVSAAAVTRQLLTFSRRHAVHLRVLDLATLVRASEKLLRRLLRPGVRLDVRSDGDAPLVRADAGQLEQVLVNLVVNACDAMPDGGALHIDVGTAHVTPDERSSDTPAAAGAFVVLRVTDTGIGMDAHTRAHLFEPFFTTKAAGKGTGLGLATVFGIAARCGGWVEVDSTVGVGSEFRVILPLVVDAAVFEPSALPPAASSAQADETVLVVEDDEVYRRLTRRMLEGRGYQVLTAASVQDAGRLVAELSGPLHLVVTDYRLPDGTGLDVREALRALRPQLRFMVMSGYASDPPMHEQLETEALKMLDKPFTGEALALAVRAALDTPVR